MLIVQSNFKGQVQHDLQNRIQLTTGEFKSIKCDQKSLRVGTNTIHFQQQILNLYLKNGVFLPPSNNHHLICILIYAFIFYKTNVNYNMYPVKDYINLNHPVYVCQLQLL